MALENIGALWIKEGKSGKFMAGNITIDAKELSIMVFKNDKKDNPKRPDYRIVMTVEEDEPQHHVRDDDDIPF